MESPSQAPHNGVSFWKELLLTASLLSCRIQPTSAQSDSVSVVLNPPYGIVGSSVILDIQGASEQPSTCTWYRRAFNPSDHIAFYKAATGEQTTADSRLTVFHNCSLFIRDLTLSDSDDYIAQFINPTNDRTKIAQGHLAVCETASKPTITASSTNIMENSTVVFTCVTENEGVNIRWFFNAALLSLNERQYLSEKNQTLTTKYVTREDAGSYQCEVWNLIRSDALTLTVIYGPDNIMFSPGLVRDEIQTTLKNPLILECHVESYPPAKYEWRVNGTVNSKFSDYKYTISNASWEDSGKYTCLAWNNMTNLLVSKDVRIKVVAEESPGGSNGSSLSGGPITGIVIGVLAGMALIGALIYFLFLRKTGGANKEHLSDKNHSASKHGEDTTMYEDIVFPNDSAQSALALGSSPAFPEVLSESAYQALDMSRAAVYEKIVPWKNPET